MPAAMKEDPRPIELVPAGTGKKRCFFAPLWAMNSSFSDSAVLRVSLFFRRNYVLD